MFFGYGNPGRQDDGLGVELAERIEQWVEAQGLTYIDCDTNYQLNIEDAATMSEYNLVVFADASKEEIDNFCLTRVKPSAEINFTSHAVSPAFVLELCRAMFDKQPDTFLLHIKGYEWKLGQGLTELGRANLESALTFVQNIIRQATTPTDLTRLFDRACHVSEVE